MREFVINKEPYEDGLRVYKKSKVQIEEGVTILVGCNGAGKTTLLHEIKRQLEKDKIPVYLYDNYREGGNSAMDKHMFYGRIDAFVSMAFKSEGEKISANLGYIANEIGHFVVRYDKSNSDERWILFDAIGSGLSIDGIDDMKNFFNFVIEHEKKDKANRKIYFIVSTNEYEFCREGIVDHKCLNVQTGEYVKLKNYDTFRDVILRTAKQKKKWLDEYNKKLESDKVNE
jgi:energy-coupling factor transporter ATP-binding protein EcfA2